jgi:predicted DNA-binding transcriptional regulator AlpA
MIAANDNIAPKLDPFLRLATVTEVTCLGKSTIYRKMEAGQFPRPLVLGPGSVRWRNVSYCGMDGRARGNRHGCGLTCRLNRPTRHSPMEVESASIGASGTGSLADEPGLELNRV